MKIRLGYVAISKVLGKKSTSSSTVTFSNYSKISSEEKKLEKLKTVTLSNFEALEQILKYNIKNQIHFYRITSALIPLATHPEVGYWGHREIFKKDFQYIGKLIKESNMRVDTHPDEFNVINSVNSKVVENTIVNLSRQAEWFEDMNYKDGKMVIHVGGATGGKEESLKRFIENFNEFPKSIKERLIIENDDKTYTAKETLNLCKILNIPMVLDIHHHNCNNNDEPIVDIIKDILDTWNNENLPPKMHFSSPRDKNLIDKVDKKHSDFIDAYDFISFIETLKLFNRDVDIMLECKEKDVALFKLVNDIRNLNQEYKWLDETTLLI
ncbi:UV DNA damage repair endonuclease UvsE [Clostridium sp. AL.422]|uniref:UV DNA damage repair endonuclease UvsE n=1 Tax=Clostridium TaxID=1485 RepID=UPI00293DA6CF|nr:MULTISPECIES: UV DNA damage repair endonuclease UvsE [unclassified Clostridium]MDV4150847.1 UV DNA damage repair endonuclease UvsE [Clostridium sp. AL.422]